MKPQESRWKMICKTLLSLLIAGVMLTIGGGSGYAFAAAGEATNGSDPGSEEARSIKENLTCAKAPTVTLQFSAVEKGKPDSQQLIGTGIGLIYNEQGFMDSWYVEAELVERDLAPGMYNYGVVRAPTGFAYPPSIVFRVNGDLSVDIAVDATDPDPVHWTWKPLIGNIIRIELERGVPVTFRNIDLMNPDVELAGASLGFQLTNGVNRVWTSESVAAEFFLVPGSEGVYEEYAPPECYVGSDPIRFKVNEAGDLLVQDANGNWFLHPGNTLVMENVGETYVGRDKYNVSLGICDCGAADAPSLPGGVIRLQRYDPVTEDFYDMPGQQWITGAEHRSVPLYAGEYRLMVCSAPEGYEPCPGTGIFKLAEDEEGFAADFYILFLPPEGGEPYWVKRDFKAYLDYRPVDKPLRIAVFRTGSKSTYNVGETVALAARAEDGTPPYRYQFYVVRSNGARVILRDYAYSNVFKWKPVTPDTYEVGVNVKDAAGTVVNQSKTVTVQSQLRIAVFRTGSKSTYNVGETVALAARAEKGTPPYRYQFYVVRSNGRRVILRNYAYSNVFKWKPVTRDTYRVGVNAKDAKGRVVNRVKIVTIK